MRNLSRRPSDFASAEQESLVINNSAVIQDDGRPFNPRTEVSADAKYVARKVVTHLWILFVALPIVLIILVEILK
jgi:hypothetical protein